LLVIIRVRPHRSEVGMSERPNPVVFTIDSGWHEIADAALTWIASRVLEAPVTTIT